MKFNEEENRGQSGKKRKVDRGDYFIASYNNKGDIVNFKEKQGH